MLPISSRAVDVPGRQIAHHLPQGGHHPKPAPSQCSQKERPRCSHASPPALCIPPRVLAVLLLARSNRHHSQPLLSSTPQASDYTPGFDSTLGALHKGTGARRSQSFVECLPPACPPACPGPGPALSIPIKLVTRQAPFKCDATVHRSLNLHTRHYKVLGIHEWSRPRR